MSLRSRRHSSFICRTKEVSSLSKGQHALSCRMTHRSAVIGGKGGKGYRCPRPRGLHGKVQGKGPCSVKFGSFAYDSKMQIPQPFRCSLIMMEMFWKGGYSLMECSSVVLCSNCLQRIPRASSVLQTSRFLKIKLSSADWQRATFFSVRSLQCNRRCC